MSTNSHLADLVDPEAVNVIQNNPFAVPAFLRSAKNLTPEQWAELQKQVEKMSPEGESQENRQSHYLCAHLQCTARDHANRADASSSSVGLRSDGPRRAHRDLVMTMVTSDTPVSFFAQFPELTRRGHRGAAEKLSAEFEAFHDGRPISAPVPVESIAEHFRYEIEISDEGLFAELSPWWHRFLGEPHSGECFDRGE